MFILGNTEIFYVEKKAQRPIEELIFPRMCVTFLIFYSKDLFDFQFSIKLTNITEKEHEIAHAGPGIRLSA